MTGLRRELEMGLAIALMIIAQTALTFWLLF